MSPNVRALWAVGDVYWIIGLQTIECMRWIQIASAPLSARIKDWTKSQIPQKAVEEIQSLFENGVDIKKTLEEKKLEEKFKPENFDLITWFVVSG